MTVAAERHKARVRELCCVPCLLIFGDKHPCQAIHHLESIRDGLSDFLVIPICQEMHQGANGIHGLSRRGFARRYGIDDWTLLAKTIELLGS